MKMSDEERKAKRKVRDSTPEAKEAVARTAKIRGDLPENKAKRKKYESSTERREAATARRSTTAAKVRHREYMNAYRATAKGKAQRKAYNDGEGKAHNQVYAKAYELNPKRKEKKRAGREIRLITDINYKIRCALRSRGRDAIRTNAKAGSFVRDLGCSIEYLKRRFEIMLEPGMTIENHGSELGQWVIDHFIPLASFDLTDREQFLRAVNYRNLRPMWGLDNSRKSDVMPSAEEIAEHEEVVRVVDQLLVDSSLA